MEGFELKKEKGPEAYFSIAHLVRKVIVTHSDGTSSEHFVAIKGKDWKDEEGKSHAHFQALGGGAKFKSGVQDGFGKEFPDVKFLEGEKSDDARFTMPIPVDCVIPPDASEEDKKIITARRNRFISDFTTQFVSLEGNNPIIESSVARELREELRDATPLEEEDLSTLRPQQDGIVSQVNWSGEPDRSKKPAGGFRIFYLWNLKLTEAQFAKLRKSEKIKILTNQDSRDIQTATAEKKRVALLQDGSVIADNVFPGYSS